MLAFSAFELEELRRLGGVMGEEVDEAAGSTVCREERQHRRHGPISFDRDAVFVRIVDLAFLKP